MATKTLAVKDKYVVTDGVKSWAPLTLNTDLGWNVISGPNLDERMTLEMLFHRVPWLFRGIDARAAAVASMPFVLYDKAGNEIDSYRDWQNEPEFLPDPRRILWLIEASLTLVNAAYLFAEKNKSGYIQGVVKYCDPRTIKPKMDKATGLDGFTRILGSMTTDKKYYSLDGKSGENAGSPCPIIYVFRADPFTEIGPGQNNSPAIAALNAASALFNKDRYISDFFERGAIKVTILSADTQDQKEAERLKGWWEEVVAGVKNAWTAFVVRAKSIVPTVIGSGLEDLKDEQLTDTMRAEIATALGIPQTKLWSQAARGLGGGGVKDSDDRQFYTDTVIPECWVIQDALNEQVFEPYGWTLKFHPEKLPVFVDDAAKNAQALLSLVQAGMPLAMAARKLNYDLSPEELEELGAALAPKPQPPQLAQAAQQPTANAQQQGAVGQPEPGQPEQGGTGSTDESRMPTSKSYDPVEVRAALITWERKAKNAQKHGHALTVPGDCESIPPAIYRAVVDGLKECKSAEDIKTLFADVTPVDPARALAEATKQLQQLAVS